MRMSLNLGCSSVTGGKEYMFRMYVTAGSPCTAASRILSGGICDQKISVGPLRTVTPQIRRSLPIS